LPPGNRRITWYANCKSESNVARGTLKNCHFLPLISPS
jgi:hypothetical protein